MKSLIFLYTVLNTVLISPFAFALPTDFKVTAPASWKRVETSFPGTIYVNSASKKKQTILIYIKETPDADLMPPAKLIDLAEPISVIREDRLASIGLDDYSTLNAEETNFDNLPRVQGLQIESQYIGYSDEMVQMVERQYFANGRIYNVVYTEESEQIGDRAAVSRLMDQFTPNANAGRAPAAVSEVARNRQARARYVSKLEQKKRKKAMAKAAKLGPPQRPPEVKAMDAVSEAARSKEQAKREWIETCKKLGVDEKDIRAFDGDDSAGHVPGCIKGLVLAIPKLLYNAYEGLTYENIKGGLSAAGSAVSSAVSSVKEYFSNPTFQSQVNTSFVSAIETVKNTSSGELASTVMMNLGNFFGTHFKEFKCRSNLSQGEQLCAFAEKMVLGGVAFKLAVPMLMKGATLTGEALAAVLKTANDARAAAMAARAGAATEGAAASAMSAGASATEAAASGAAAGGFGESVRKAGTVTADNVKKAAQKATETAREKAKAAGDAVRSAAAKAGEKLDAQKSKLKEFKERRSKAQSDKKEAAAREQREKQEAAAKEQRERQEAAARAQREQQEAAAREQAKAKEAVASSQLRNEVDNLTKGFDEKFIDRVSDDINEIYRVTQTRTLNQYMAEVYRPQVKRYMELMNKKDQLTPEEKKRADTFLKALNVMKERLKAAQKFKEAA